MMSTTQNSRERVIRAIEFKGPDRVPLFHYAFPGAFYRHKEKLVKLLKERYPDDFGGRTYYIPEEMQASDEFFKVEYTDAWGCKWVRLNIYSTGEVREAPLADWAAFKSYKFPALPSAEHFKDFKRQIVESGHEFYVLAGGGSLFGQLQWLRGPANLYMDIAEDREELHQLADKLLKHWNSINEQYLATGVVDGVGFGDDWGSQTGLLISPKYWRQFFKPRYKEMFDLVHQAGAHVHFHTDGVTMEIIPDLIEIGVDVINPQLSCMDIDELGRRFGGKVCFRSDLDRQYILPRGTPEEVREHTKHIIKVFGNFNGGLIGHGEIGPDVPLENVEAMLQAFTEYGTYPLDWIE